MLRNVGRSNTWIISLENVVNHLTIGSWHSSTICKISFNYIKCEYTHTYPTLFDSNECVCVLYFTVKLTSIVHVHIVQSILSRIYYCMQFSINWTTAMENLKYLTPSTHNEVFFVKPISFYPVYYTNDCTHTYCETFINWFGSKRFLNI